MNSPSREIPIDPELEKGYNVRLLRDDIPQLFESWTLRSKLFCSHADAQLNCAYDDGPRDKLDLFRCGDRDAPLLVFFHGGYWQRGDKSLFSFIAEPFVERGIDVALIGYQLAPEIDLSSMVGQLRKAMIWLWRNADRYEISAHRINVCGHSAGGHLTAMMLTTGWQQFGDDLPVDLVKTAIPMSGLYQLEPLRHTTINDALGMDAEAAYNNSPYFLQPPTNAPILVTIGGDESPQLRWQTDQFVDHWGRYTAPIEVHVEPGVDHFDLANRLADCDSEFFSKAHAWLR
jgi:arylformamidase